MIVYVETNFLLELAYRQERCVSCDGILELASSGSISVVLPAFCIAEARTTLERRALERRDVHEALQKQIRQISRSESFRGLTERSSEVVTALIAYGEHTRDRLERAVESIAETGVIVPLNATIVDTARVHEIVDSLSPQDALVLESVRWHAAQTEGPKCFVTQDAKGFANPSIYDELSAVDCKVLVNFADALNYIRHNLGSSE